MTVSAWVRVNGFSCARLDLICFRSFILGASNLGVGLSGIYCFMCPVYWDYMRWILNKSKFFTLMSSFSERIYSSLTRI